MEDGEYDGGSELYEAFEGVAESGSFAYYGGWGVAAEYDE